MSMSRKVPQIKKRYIHSLSLKTKTFRLLNPFVFDRRIYAVGVDVSQKHFETINSLKDSSIWQLAAFRKLSFRPRDSIYAPEGGLSGKSSIGGNHPEKNKSKVWNATDQIECNWNVNIYLK